MSKKSRSTKQATSPAEPSFEQVRELFEAVEDLEHTLDELDDDADRAVLEAAERGDARALGDALAIGGNPNAVRESSGESALVLAIASGHVDAVAALLAARARPTSCDVVRGSVNLSISPLALARYHRKPEIVALLTATGGKKARAPASSPDEELGLAVFFGDAARVAEALAAGASPDGRDPDRQMPWLGLAVNAGATAVVRTLLEAGADPNTILDYLGAKRSVLDDARQGEHFEIVKLLLAAGGKPSKKPYRRKRPAPREPSPMDAKLGTAVAKNDKKAVHDLLMKGADPNGSTKGEPFLAIAVRGGYVQVARELMQCEAYPDVEHDGVPVLHLAAERGDVKMVEELLLESADPNRRAGKKTIADVVVTLATKPQHAILRQLLRWGLDPNITTSNGRLVSQVSGDSRQLMLAHGAAD